MKIYSFNNSTTIMIIKKKKKKLKVFFGSAMMKFDFERIKMYKF